MKQFKRPQKMLGPSQVATVLGFNHFETPDELRFKMENGYSREISALSRAGICDEPRCRKLYSRTYDTVVQRCPFVKDTECRFGGSGDGLIGNDGGLEIKCQYGTGKAPVVYNNYKIQAVAYMHLYKRDWWDIMVCNITNNQCDALIERVYWKDYENTWNEKWYPSIKIFCQSVKWAS